MAAKERRILTIVEKEAVAHGPDDDWTLYEVKALDEAGSHVDFRLKTFDDVELDVELEFEVEHQSDERYGDSFLLKKVKKRSKLQRSVDELRDRVEVLEKVMKDAGLLPD